MRDRRRLGDQDLDRLLAGRAPSGGDPLDGELAAFVQDVRAAFTAPPPVDIERRHLARTPFFAICVPPADLDKVLRRRKRAPNQAELRAGCLRNRIDYSSDSYPE